MDLTPQITAQEFWLSPLGIIIIGLAVGVVAILIIRGLMRSAKWVVRKRPAAKPRGAPRAKSMNYPDFTDM
jgi:hypothetical protein